MASSSVSKPPAGPRTVTRLVITDSRTGAWQTKDFADLAALRNYAYQDPESGVHPEGLPEGSNWQAEISRRYPHNDQRFANWFIKTYMAESWRVCTVCIYEYLDYD